MRIEEYLDAVCGEIRWKAARAQVREEIRTHIEQRADEYAADGDSREVAEARAVAQMGDAEKTGRELDRLHRPRYDWVLIGSVAALLILGIFQAVTAQSDDLSTLGWIGGLVLGISGCVLFSLINYRKLLAKIRHPMVINLTCLACLALFSRLSPLIPDIFSGYNRFFMIFIPYFLLFFGMVVSEVAWAARIKTQKGWNLFFITAIVSTAALYLLGAGLYLLEYAMCVWALVWMNRAEKKHSPLPAVAGAVLIFLIGFCVTELLPYFSFISSSNGMLPEWTPIFKADDLNWFGHGYWFSGLQYPVQEYDYNSITNFVWQYGIVAGIALIGFCGVSIWRINRIRRGIRDSIGKQLAVCFCMVFSIHAIWSIALGMGLDPLSSESYLPVLSLQFPMSLIQGSMIGILISLFRTKDNYARVQTAEILPG